MCGITGIWQSHPSSNIRAHAHRMADSLIHRGPDDVGVWVDQDVGLALGHRRLAVVELSSAGHQPMASAGGRYALVFNGEIYNHLDLRARLGDAVSGWQGHSDTETLLACIQAWGLLSTLEQVVGMFALALWDRQEKTLSLARDRMGEKPLYWGWQGDTLLFGSELKALKTHPDFRGEVDRDALTLLLRYNYIPSPHCIYKGIAKLAPGHFVVIRAGDKIAAPRSYWSYQSVVLDGLQSPFVGSDEQAVDKLETLLESSLAGQMMADVPLGAFLSGGVDSSVVVALMQRLASRQVHTYAIGFEDKSFDEAQHARAVAAYLGTDHTEMHVTERDALAVVPDLPRIYCEPFADSSQIPMVLVSRMARQHVTVALSGDGGDELFGGYTPYWFLPRIWRMIRWIPRPLRQGLARMLSPLPVPQRFEKLLEIFDARDYEQLYWRLRSHWTDPESIVRSAREPDSLLRNPQDFLSMRSFASWMMAVDTMNYMPDDILVKVDRAAMSNSLETRVPMLDHRVVEFSARMPVHLKIRNGQGKWALRQLLYRHVPQSLVDRPKAGFMVPLAAWLRGPLRDWADTLLQESRMRQEGYFNVKEVQKTWQEHLTGRVDRSSKLWSVLMFQAWLADQ